MRDKVTILVCTCDSYDDLWRPFFVLLRKHWPKNTCKILLNTESKEYSFEGLDIQTIPREDASALSYGCRIRECLQSIETPYTLLLLDDFFIRRDIDESRIEAAVQMMQADEDISAIYFNNEGLGQLEPYGNGEYGLMKKYAMYKLNMQASLWDTKRLLSYWKEEDDPWKWEMFANYETFDKPDKFLAITDNENTPIYYGYKTTGMGVFRGKWVVDDVEPLFKENGIDIDFSIRGVYEKASEKNYFKNKTKLALYLVRRMRIRYIVGLCGYYAKRKVYRWLGKTEHFSSYPAQLQYKYERKLERKEVL